MSRHSQTCFPTSSIEISRNQFLKFLDKRTKTHLRIIAFLGFHLLNEISFQSHSFKLSQETEIIFVVENLSLAIKNLKINTYIFIFMYKKSIKKWYFVTKIVLTYCEKKCSSGQEKLLKFEA